MIQKREFDEPAVYQIRVNGCLDQRWRDWFDGLNITPQANCECMLVGPVSDQAALHGLLGKLRDLGLPILLVIRTTDGSDVKGGTFMLNQSDPKMLRALANMRRDALIKEAEHHRLVQKARLTRPGLRDWMRDCIGTFLNRAGRGFQQRHKTHRMDRRTSQV